MEIKFDLRPELIGEPAITAYADGMLSRVRQLVFTRPGPHVALTHRIVRNWERKFMFEFGRAFGNLEAIGNLGKLPMDKVKSMIADLKRFLQYHIGVLFIGGE